MAPRADRRSRVLSEAEIQELDLTTLRPDGWTWNVKILSEGYPIGRTFTVARDRVEQLADELGAISTDDADGLQAADLPDSAALPHAEPGQAEEMETVLVETEPTTRSEEAAPVPTLDREIEADPESTGGLHLGIRAGNFWLGSGSGLHGLPGYAQSSREPCYESYQFAPDAAAAEGRQVRPERGSVKQRAAKGQAVGESATAAGWKIAVASLQAK
ncbi:unnamed protein product, partial [Symbiodinium sp. CCMP2456]